MRPITQIMADYNDGKFVEELTETLHNLIGDCTSTGKKGKLSITIELKPAKGATPALNLSMDYTDKSPDFDRPSEYMFVTENFDLTRENPKQRKLELREVTPKTLPVRGDAPPGVDPETGEIVAA